jgi:cyclase
MFFGATPPIFQRAKELRNHLTYAEIVLWNYLRTHPQGYKFRRQHPIGNFIADFYCHRLKLIIEVDGSIHDKESIKEADEEKQQILEAAGIKVMRFRNEEVLKEKDKIIRKINNWINAEYASTKI